MSPQDKAPGGGIKGASNSKPLTPPAAMSSSESPDFFAAPSISQPKGGGAIRGIGEKFTANPVAGTGSVAVPVAVSPGRAGFGPRLALSYDSGSGNGPFGFGWSLSLPGITRKTDKGLPLYQDEEESDVFILSGAEDLVPELDAAGRRFEDMSVAPGYTVHRYRPRIEATFARIERWTRRSDGDVHWRALSRDNILTLYGRDANSRIADPVDARCVFSWLVSETRDDKGNAIVYEYKPEDGVGVDLARPHERNRGERDDPRRTANRYLKRIRYGNRVPLLDPDGRRPHFLPSTTLQDTAWLFEVVLDYGEHDAEAPRPDDTGTWLCRSDPFSVYRAGFDLRTYRLCRRFLMFHHFPGEDGVGQDCLVRSTDLAYRDDSAVASLLTVVGVTSYRRDASGYHRRSLPPLEFDYSRAVVGEQVCDVDAGSADALLEGSGRPGWQWVDLDGEGLTGVLSEQAGAWFYKRNESPLSRDGATARFAPVEQLRRQPSRVTSTAGRRQFLDLAGDGRLDLVTLAPPMTGFQERDDEEGWTPFRAFSSIPNVAWSDPNLKFVDLTGDGHADILISEGHGITWHASLGEAGFGPSRRLAAATDEERGPRVVFADGTETISLADMSGDGLTDIVRIRNGEVCYWPNLGYGRFGAKVTMDGAPRFDMPNQFDPRRLRLVDIDGSGVTDIIYLGRDGVRCWFNRSGNGWSASQALSAFPSTDDVDAVTTVDLLGNGTACMVWPARKWGAGRGGLRYLALMAEGKPHLLTSMRNNLGAETHVRYAPSTYFYLKDKREGRPWVTRLPFPVHVVERVETVDRIGRNRFVTRYAYHHGYFDGEEREFRGFGMVEQFDTEEFAALSSSDAFPDAANIDAASHVPPAYIKTWFHTGAFVGREKIERCYERDYFRDDAAPPLPDTVLPTTLKRPDGSEQPWSLSTEEIREACRSLKGAILRREIYARDGSDAEGLPYSVSESNYTIALLQPKGPNRNAVFFTHPREEMTLQHERKLRRDPRISHAVTLVTDAYGNVLRSAAIGYGRRRPDDDPLLSMEDRETQSAVLITCSENSYTNAVDGSGTYHTPLPAEARNYEIIKVAPASPRKLLGFDDLQRALQQAGDGRHDLPYEDVAAAGAVNDHPYRRLIDHSRTLYRRDDLAGVLPAGRLESRALPFESYRKAFTPGLAHSVFVASGKLIDRELAEAFSEGGYRQVEGDDGWWVSSGRVFFHPDAAATGAQEFALARRHFFTSLRFRDPFGNETRVRYDDYDLLRLETEDALDNRVTAGKRDASGDVVSSIDYRLLQPALITDPNGNRTAVAFDVLGLVAGTAVMGKAEEALGDSLEGFIADLSQAQIDAFFADPRGQAAALLGNATTRIVSDVDRYYRTGDAARPGFAASIGREQHGSDLAPGAVSPVQISISYGDGFGRETQKKMQAEAGPLDGGDAASVSRWVGSGWTIFNNKGLAVRQYEPFFTASHDFEFARVVGVSSITFYDPLGRTVVALYPNHTYEKFLFDPWRQETWDVNDTVALDPLTDPDVAPYFARLPKDAHSPTWFDLRTRPALAAQARRDWPDPLQLDAERDAADRSAAHARTPARMHLDSQARTFLTIADNAAAGKYASRVGLDIKGNHRVVSDALGRKVVAGDYDMLGNRIYLTSADAGARWILNDVAGKPLYAWDSRGHRMHTTYDELRRPVASLLREGTGQEQMVGRTVYGESRPAPELNNLRGKAVQSFDQAGCLTSDVYDFKGNLARSRRQLTTTHSGTVDWSGDVALEAEIHETTTRYDALSRPIVLSLPGGNVVRPGYNDANLLERVDADLGGSSSPTAFVTGIEYNAKGQRTHIAYGNGTHTRYSYELATSRLIRSTTKRTSDGALLQDFAYAYDPVGNIAAVRDDAQQTVYYGNQAVSPNASYRYDALYRLIGADGREHAGQLAPAAPTWDDEARRHLPLPGDGQAMRRYSEHYEYDPVGNLLRLIHQAAGGNWTRAWQYHEASLLEPSHRSNRLSSTAVDDEAPATYAHDIHGNVTQMPHLAMMAWDFSDRLQATQQQVVNGASGDVTYYIYDTGGQRVRKVAERADGSKRKERIYLGVFEVYREYGRDGSISLERTTLHVADGAERIAFVDTRTRGDDESPRQLIRYQFGNHLGSINLEVDGAGRIISHEEYHPYGTTSYQAGRNLAEVSLKRYRYTGKERDEETGFTFHGARYYAPWLGRWTSSDPAGLVDGLNVFAYARNNPILFRDRNGQDVGQARQGMLQSLAKSFDDYWSFRQHLDDYYIDTGIEHTHEESEYAWEMAYAPEPEMPDYEWRERYSREENWFDNLIIGEKWVKVPTDPEKRKAFMSQEYDRAQLQVAVANQPSGEDWANMASANAAAMETEADIDLNIRMTVPRQIPGAEIEFKPSARVDLDFDMPATKTMAPDIPTESERLAPLRAEALGGQRVWLVGPEGASSTRAIRIVDNRVTYDTRAPGGQGRVRADMKAIANHFGLGEDMAKGNWWTGTHGNPEGEFMGPLLEPRFYDKERGFGRFYGWNVLDVSRSSRGQILLDDASDKPTVYSWCFSSACFIVSDE